MKLMKKVFVSVFLWLSLFVIITPFLEVRAEPAETLVVHYYRFDEDYSKWSLWLWQMAPNKGDGLQYQFNGQDGKKNCKIRARRCVFSSMGFLQQIID